MAKEISQDDIDLNLDTVEFESTKPFVFVFKGRKMQMTDPNKVDWKTLASLEQPVHLIRHVMSEEDKQFLRDNYMSIEQLKRLLDDMSKHFPLPELGKDADSPI